MSVSSPFQRSIGASCGGGQEKPSRVYVSILDATKKWFVYEEILWFHGFIDFFRQPLWQ